MSQPDSRTPVQVTTDAAVHAWDRQRSRGAVDRIVARFRVTVLAEALEVIRKADSRDEAMRELTRMVQEGGQEQERKVT